MVKEPSYRSASKSFVLTEEDVQYFVNSNEWTARPHSVPLHSIHTCSGPAQFPALSRLWCCAVAPRVGGPAVPPARLHVVSPHDCVALPAARGLRVVRRLLQVDSAAFTEPTLRYMLLVPPQKHYPLHVVHSNKGTDNTSS
jgi:hypothetical protein